jgi:hypothetical protein
MFLKKKLKKKILKSFEAIETYHFVFLKLKPKKVKSMGRRERKGGKEERWKRGKKGEGEVKEGKVRCGERMKKRKGKSEKREIQIKKNRETR